MGKRMHIKSNDFYHIMMMMMLMDIIAKQNDMFISTDGRKILLDEMKMNDRMAEQNGVK